MEWLVLSIVAFGLIAIAVVMKRSKKSGMDSLSKEERAELFSEPEVTDDTKSEIDDLGLDQSRKSERK